MHSNISTRTLVAAVGTILTFAACNKDAKPAGEPARDIQLAPVAATTPQLNDAPVKAPPAPAPAPARAPTKAPVRNTPAPAPVYVAPAPPAPRMAAASQTGTVAAGTSLTVNPSAAVCTNTHKAGDRFTATLAEAVYGTNGTMIPAGSAMVMRVLESARSQDGKNGGKLTFDVLSIRVGEETYEVDGAITASSATDKIRAQSSTDQVKKAGAGAAIGAIAGQILGKNTKSTVIGAVVGGAAGAAVAAGQADYDACLPTTGTITVSLNRALVIKRAA